MVGKMARAAVQNRRGLYAICRLRKNACDYNKSLTLHWLDGFDIFVAEPFANRMVDVYYYDSLVCTDLCNGQNTILTYGEWFIEFQGRHFKGGLVISIRKSWIGISLTTMCGFCQLRSFLGVR